MQEPLVSVIIPIFNRAQLLRRAIDSVMRQSFRDFELIVVDDASTEPLDAALQGWDPGRLRVVRHPWRQGAGSARNSGVAEARGRFVAFLDSDDAWAAEKLERQLALHEQEPDLDASCTGFSIIRDGAPVSSRIPRTSPETLGEQLLWGCNLSPGSTLFVRRDVFAEVGPFDPTLRRLEDWDWLLRFASRFRLAVVEETLADIHVSARPPSDQVQQAVRILWSKHRDALPEPGAAARRKFRSSLRVELAAALFREGRTGAALLTVGGSLLTWPFRRRSFYARGAQVVWGSAPWRPSRAAARTAKAPALPIAVTIVTQKLDIGGTEKHLLEVLPRLDRSRYLVTVLPLRTGGVLEPQFRQRDVLVEAFDLAHSGFLRPPLLLGKLFVRFLWERHAIAHFFLPEPYILGGLASWLARNPHRLMSRRSLNDYQAAHVGVRAVEGFLHRRMLAAIGNSRAVVDQLIGEKGSSDDVYLIYNGINLDDYDPSQLAQDIWQSRQERRPRLVLTIVANYFAYKGHEDLLQALAAVHRDIPDVTLVCVGRDQGRLATCQATARELGISGSVIWLNEMDDIRPVLGGSDILVSASHQEGFSNSILEAMAMELPVIATRVGGNPEAVADGETGILVEPQDPAQLAAAIIQLAGDRELRRRMGSAARQRVAQKFDLDDCVRAYESLYSAISQARPLRLGADQRLILPETAEIISLERSPGPISKTSVD